MTSQDFTASARACDSFMLLFFLPTQRRPLMVSTSDDGCTARVAAAAPASVSVTGRKLSVMLAHTVNH